MNNMFKRKPLSTKFKTNNKFLIYCKYNFFNGIISGTGLISLFIFFMIEILAIITFIFVKSDFTITSALFAMLIGILLLVSAVISINTTLNTNINKKVNRIFLFGGITRSDVRNYALIYNLIVLMLEALITVVLSVILFGIIALAHLANLIKILNLEFFAMLLLKILSAHMLGILISVLMGVLPKGGVLVLVLFFMVQYLLVSLNFACTGILIENGKGVYAWIIIMIPSVSSNSIVWWKFNHWVILLGYLYNLVLISLLIWAWLAKNNKTTY